MKQHIFVVCAFGASPYLDACLHSLKLQRSPSDILICTPKMNEHIRALAAKYRVPVYVRQGKPGLRDDWNFAYEQGAAHARLVTLVHQDDLYFPDYSRAVLFAFRHFPDMSVFCCGCDTIDAAGNTLSGSSERVKRWLRLPLRFHERADRRSVKLASLKWGNAIACPSCTYNTAYCEAPLFRGELRYALDWDTLLRLAEAPGRFISLEKKLMAYRLHADSETLHQMALGARSEEETAILRRLHGPLLGPLWMRLYRRAHQPYEALKPECAERETAAAPVRP